MQVYQQQYGGKPPRGTDIPADLIRAYFHKQATVDVAERAAGPPDDLDKIKPPAVDPPDTPDPATKGIEKATKAQGRSR